MAGTCAHIDLDGAWPADLTAADGYVDVRNWGPRLRYSTNERELIEFADFVRGKLAAFTLFGSGDFHHLSALWIRRIAEPFTLVSFDNHPDWDVRPPRWCCGTWINRALEMPNLHHAAIWGCGNFELNWPGYLYVNRDALRAQRLAVWPWTERLKASGRKRWPGMTPENWRAQFNDFARRIAGENVYVTVDLDCLDVRESATNWEQGLFTAEDIAWALGVLRAHSTLVGGDLCGAYSEQKYSRWRQWFAAKLDHPRQSAVDPALNRRAFSIIWPALVG